LLMHVLKRSDATGETLGPPSLPNILSTACRSMDSYSV
jgi:hypothetical protein